MTILMEQLERTEEAQTEQGFTTNEALARKVLFDPTIKAKPLEVAPRNPKELQEMKRILKSLIAEAWKELG